MEKVLISLNMIVMFMFSWLLSHGYPCMSGKVVSFAVYHHYSHIVLYMYLGKWKHCASNSKRRRLIKKSAMVFSAISLMLSIAANCCTHKEAWSCPKRRGLPRCFWVNVDLLYCLWAACPSSQLHTVSQSVVRHGSIRTGEGAYK